MFHRDLFLCDEGLKSPVAETPPLCLFYLWCCSVTHWGPISLWLMPWKKKNISPLLFEWKWKLHLLISFCWPVGINLLGADWPTAVTSSPCHNSSFVPFAKGCHVSMAIGSIGLQIHVHTFSPGSFDRNVLYGMASPAFLTHLREQDRQERAWWQYWTELLLQLQMVCHCNFLNQLWCVLIEVVFTKSKTYQASYGF